MHRARGPSPASRYSKVIPFAATLDVISGLLARAAPPPCIAATEAVPSSVPGDAPWKRVLDAAGRPAPYLIPSPVMQLTEANGTVAFIRL